MDGGKAGIQRETDRPPFYLGQRMCSENSDKEMDVRTVIEKNGGKLNDFNHLNEFCALR